VLQWGRGPWTAETGAASLANKTALVASMGPRSVDRGNRLRGGISSTS